MPRTLAQVKEHYRSVWAIPEEAERNEVIRGLAAGDLFFLLVGICGRKDIGNRQWLLERCDEVQLAPDGYLDLWARDHYKSSLITFGKTLQDILIDPEVTVGIFSHTRPIAKGFLRQLKREMETNVWLKRLWPGIFWQDPAKEAPSWSEDAGLIVRRKGNPKEATIEAHGLVEGQPTARHYRLVVYDDVVTRESVYTPEMIAKTTEAWEHSLNLGTQGGVVRYAGTRYAAGDTYEEIIDRGAAIPRIHPAEDDLGEPVLLSREELDEKLLKMGPVTYSTQMLLLPTADSVNAFKREWVKYHDGVNHRRLNRCIIVDPARSKKRGSDWTVMWVLGYGADRNWYILDLIRDRLSLTERMEHLFELHRKWTPMKVGYKATGCDVEVDAIRERQRHEAYSFGIIPISETTPKRDRIEGLLPVMQRAGLWWLRERHYTQRDGKTVNLINYVIERELLSYPAVRYDDALDALADICGEEMTLPVPRPPAVAEERYRRDRRAAAQAGNALGTL